MKEMKEAVLLMNHNWQDVRKKSRQYIDARCEEQEGLSAVREEIASVERKMATVKQELATPTKSGRTCWEASGVAFMCTLKKGLSHWRRAENAASLPPSTGTTCMAGHPDSLTDWLCSLSSSLLCPLRFLIQFS
ncbi:hypothetical protein E2C01_052581 [Portunus trituberculatus]|uniref:Uncharacterized protein n=1 Tax=Portunus trituberculatus TaxID=210409 RepID=A0A5B7GM96_PORTR|nr:hypothetical protein [Portunus trituberculatus]